LHGHRGRRSVPKMKLGRDKIVALAKLGAASTELHSLLSKASYNFSSPAFFQTKKQLSHERMTNDEVVATMG
jgi:hypothetical protein